MCEIDISVSVMSRGRKDLLKKNLLKLYEFAKNPEKIELIVILDNDDIESINIFKEDEQLKQFENIRLFIIPRIGWANSWKVIEFVFSIFKGDIIVPFADDCEINMVDWDEKFLHYRDIPAYIGHKARMALSRKVIEQHPFIKLEGWKILGGDTIIYRYAVEKGIYFHIPKWYGKVGPPFDKTKMEGTYGEWRLKDLSILDSLKFNEINIYEH